MGNAASEKVVLVIDDDPLVCRALSRILKRWFNEVLTATSSSTAERALARNRVTHVVSYCDIRGGVPLGIESVPDWRKVSPSLERVVMYSGTDLPTPSVRHDDDVDVVVSKSVDPGDILKALDIKR